MNQSEDAFRYKALDYRSMIVVFLLLVITVYCLVTGWPFFTTGVTFPLKIFFGLLGIATVYWASRWSKDLQLFLPMDKPRYRMGNCFAEIESLQVHICFSRFFSMKFLRINKRLFVIVPAYKNPFDHNPKAIQQQKADVTYLKNYIEGHELGKRHFLDLVALCINFLFWLLILVSVVAIMLLLFKIFAY
jgi:hypothetical protein